MKYYVWSLSASSTSKHVQPSFDTMNDHQLNERKKKHAFNFAPQEFAWINSFFFHFFPEHSIEAVVCILQRIAISVLRVRLLMMRRCYHKHTLVRRWIFNVGTLYADHRRHRDNVDRVTYRYYITRLDSTLHILIFLSFFFVFFFLWFSLSSFSFSQFVVFWCLSGSQSATCVHLKSIKQIYFWEWMNVARRPRRWCDSQNPPLFEFDFKYFL